MRSIEQQEKIIREAVNQSKLEPTFIFDERWERPNDDDTVYPLVNIWTEPFTFPGRMINQPYSMMVVDYSDKDGSMRLSNLSDCQLLMVDILNLIREKVNGLTEGPAIKLTSIGTGQKVVDDEANHATGWIVQFSLEQIYDRDYCSTPKK